ncbi:MAG: hypothetical protein OEZ06_09370 [Myxococcales bacterium]|nr:hypothetical protein [Myxococcales bacterium]
MQGSLFEGFAGFVPIACVDVPALALQLVLRAHPEWRDEPVVVVADDRPQAAILWSNRPARRHRILRGTSVAQARALSATLHAEVVPPSSLEAAIDGIFELLIKCSPRVEPVLAEPGLFWVDPGGLDGLFGDVQRWAAHVHRELAAMHYVSSVVVGFRRGSALALARQYSGVRVLEDPEQERQLAASVPLARLGIDSRQQAELSLLGIGSVGELLEIPVSQLRIRYGEGLGRLHDFLSGKSWSPLSPRKEHEPLLVTLEIDPPDDDHARILFGLKGALHHSVPLLVEKQCAITALDIVFELERGEPHAQRIETAAPTLDVVQIVDLLRLRLANVELPARVERLLATLEYLRVHPRQLSLMDLAQQVRRPRDLEAAARALARLRASFGAQAVVCARLREAHLPEAAFHYEPTAEVRTPHPPAASGLPPLVRRIFRRPLRLLQLPGQEPAAWLGRQGSIKALHGPNRIAGGWWVSHRERDYYYAETQHGEVLWLFYDRPGRRWYLHGIVD